MAKSRTRKTRSNYQNPKTQNTKTFQSDKNVIDITQYKKPKIQLIPKNLNQEEYINALYDDRVSIIVATGPAGCGKTYLGTLAAIKAYNEGKYDKIIVSRPNRAVDDKDIGYLPGDIFQKMLPWTIPILDIFKEFYSVKHVEQMIEEEIIEMCPIAYVRGRTFKNAIVIVDEAQGTTKNSMMSLLTRIGINSKIIVTGDLDQSDIGRNNGLEDFLNRYRPSEHIKLVHFGINDVERSPVVREVLKLYS